MKNTIKSIKVNAILNTVKTVLGVIFPLITFPYVSRILQVETLGKYNFSASFISYFQLLAALGISTYAIREGTNYRNDKDKINEFVSEIYLINILSTLISYISLIIVLLLFHSTLSEYVVFILILSVQMAFTTIGMDWVCNIYEDFLFVAIRTILIQIISLVGIFIFIQDPGDIYKYCIIIVLANSATSLFNHFYVKRKYVCLKLVSLSRLKRHLKPVLVIFATSVAMTIYVNSDTTLLGLMRNDIEVGLYGVAVKIYTIIKNILAAALTVLIPRFSILLNDNDNKGADVLFSKAVNWINMLTLPAIVGLFFESENIIFLISGSSFLEASMALKLLSVAILFSLYAYLYVQCILIPLRKENIVFIATIISSIINIGLNLVLIPYWGLNAAAFTTIIAEGITAFIAIRNGRKDIKMCGVLQNTAKVIAGCLVIAIVCIINNCFLDNRYWTLGITGISSIGAYFIILLCLRHDIVCSILKKVF